MYRRLATFTYCLTTGQTSRLEIILAGTYDLTDLLGEDETDDFETEEMLEPDDLDSGDIRRPFDPNQIKVVTSTKNVDLIKRRIDRSEVDLAPDFQRAQVWTPTKKSRLIESLLLKIPIPVFYVSADLEDNWSVVDGVQRLSTIQSFMDNEFALRNLEYLTEYSSRKYDKLPRAMQRRIEETELLFHVIQPGTPDVVKFNIFTRINTGGMPLSPQELRHALNPGQARDFLKTLVLAEPFRKATGGGMNDTRMGARECALRFSAFYPNKWEAYDENDLNSYLNQAMKHLNKITKDDLSDLRAAFDQSMVAAARIFQTDAFRKPRDRSGQRKPLSKPLFEAWSVNLARVEKPAIEALVGNRHRLMENYKEALSEDPWFERSITVSTGTAKSVSIRFQAVRDIISDTLGVFG